MADMVDGYGLPIWPAAERNKGPILRELVRLLSAERARPPAPLFVEIASGTGQHIEHFARELSQFRFQPTDHAAEHLETLRRRHELGVPILPPLALDAARNDWPLDAADVVYCANMIHIASFDAVEGLFRGAARLLSPGGLLLTYGPYRRGGQHTAPSNEAFDLSLRERDPAWGVRDIDELVPLAEAGALCLREEVSMPANNLLLVWEKG